jgi:lysophospholipase L1-like esterase
MIVTGAIRPGYGVRGSSIVVASWAVEAPGLSARFPSGVALALVALLVAGSIGARPSSAHERTSPRSARIRVLLIGESEAGTLANGAPVPPERHGLAARSDLVLWDSTLLGCSISTAPVFVLVGGEKVENQCGGAGRWQQRWSADVRATKPDVVFVMAGARDVYDVAEPDGTVLRPGEPTWAARYRADVRELFRIVGSTGAPIVAVKPVCFGPNTLPDGGPSEPEKLDPARSQAVAKAWEAAARESGVRLLDLDDVVCPGGVADPVIRADGVHFTVAGADQLAPRVAVALHRAVTAASSGPGSAPRPRSDPADRG